MHQYCSLSMLLHVLELQLNLTGFMFSGPSLPTCILPQVANSLCVPHYRVSDDNTTLWHR